MCENQLEKLRKIRPAPNIIGMSLRRRIIKWLWKNHRDLLLDLKGLGKNTIHYDTDFLDLFIEIYHKETALLRIRDMYNLYKFVQQVKMIDGDIAEVGVYKGGSAKIICEVKGSKHLHLFDTFEGVPDVYARIDKVKKREFSDTSLEDVKNYLADYDKVHFYKGYFPESTKVLVNKTIKFCFVNLDVESYKSTLDALIFFYARMNKGGIILCHDYRQISCPGVKKAFDEFFVDKAEPIVELWDNHCLMIKY
jgi:hypothetical protein